MSPQDVEAGQLTGVWSTDESCYRFLAGKCRAGDRTLETGSGISTILFGGWGVQHRCVAPGQVEIDAIADYCRAHDISLERVTFDVAPSDAALTVLPADDPPLDVVLIDGSHGFPVPMIDWYYGAGRLKRGGIVVVDDVHLPAVQILDQFLDLDPRWKSVKRDPKWVAYERLSDGPVGEDWYMQPFYRQPDPRVVRAGVTALKVRGRLGQAKRYALARVNAARGR